MVETPLCNLYSVTTSLEAHRQFIREFYRNENMGNYEPLYGVFPNYRAPVIRNTDAGRELAMLHWGMPSPKSILDEAAVKRRQTRRQGQARRHRGAEADGARSRRHQCA